MPDQKSRRNPGVKLPKFKFTVLKRQGNCYHNYEVGDEFILDDFTHPPKHFCTGVVQCAFPCMYALTFGAEFKFMENMRSITTTCPDNGIITFKIEVFSYSRIDKGEAFSTSPNRSSLLVTPKTSQPCPHLPSIISYPRHSGFLIGT